MRISEAYEHEPLLSCQRPEETKPPVSGGCDKIGTQCVDIAAPLVLTPSASVETVTVACQGTPDISCAAAPDGSSCTVTMSQQLCVTVSVCYGVTLAADEPTIACADSSCIGCGCC